MPTPQQKLSLLVTAYRSLSSAEWGPRTVKGNLPPLNQQISALLSDLYTADLIEVSAYHNGSSILVSEIDPTRHAGVIFLVELFTNQNPSIPFVKTLQDLLDLSMALTKRPIGFYIDNLNYYSEDSCDPPDVVTQYYSVLSFIEVLKRISDYADDSDPKSLRLVFLLKEKREVLVEYSAADVAKSGSSDSLLNFIESSPHESNKKDILKGVVVDTIKNSRTPFTTLLRSMIEISRRATDNYAVFVSEFSFDKIRDEIEKRKAEYILRISKVFSDIQDKLLGVPLALIIASTQIDLKNSYSKNTAIICGISIFTIFMAMLIKNQMHNLQAIKEEYCYQEEMLEHEFSSLHSKISQAFTTISCRWKSLKWKLYGVSALVLVNYIFAYGLYFKWTVKFRRAVLYLWSTF